MKWVSDNLTLDLPDDFHFCAIIYEMDKQYYHAKRWFEAKLSNTLEENGFKFKKWKCDLLSELDLMK